MHHDSLFKASRQGTLEGGQRRGWQRKSDAEWRRQKVDVPASAETAHDNFPQKKKNTTKNQQQRKLEENICWIVPHVGLPPMTRLVKGLYWTEPN